MLLEMIQWSRENGAAERTINCWSDILEEVRVMASVVQVERLTLNKSNTEYAEEQEGSKRMCKDARM